jgi:ubiquinone/menaquinone biosynthesis C-methylase UbiE
MAYDDPDFVARQYRDASNLGARISLHRRFSTGEQPLPRWIFDQLELPPDGRLLELGCGPGNLWTENLERIPQGWSITLTDISPGMVQEAEGRFGSDGRFAFRTVDARELPFEDDAFDAVVANHMLYHVPDRDRAFAEIVRVLAPGGTLYAATNGQNAQREMGWMQRVLDPSHPDEDRFFAPLAFSLENGAKQLSRWFPEVSLLRHEDALAVTEVQPLLDYLVSGGAYDVARNTPADVFDRRVSELTEKLKRELAARGEIWITKDPGLFVARA